LLFSCAVADAFRNQFGGTGTAPVPCVDRVLPAHGWTAVQCRTQCGRQRASGDVHCERQDATRKAPAGRAAAGLLITVALSRGLAQRTSPLACWRPPLQGEAYASGLSASGVSPLACRSFSNLPAQFFKSEDAKDSKGFRTIETFFVPVWYKKSFNGTKFLHSWCATCILCNQWHTIQILTHFWL